MGLADRDYMRGPKAARGGAPPLLIAALLVLAAAIAYPSSRDWLRTRLSGGNKAEVFTYHPLGLGGVASTQLGSPYPAHDRWRSFLPSPDFCAGSTSASVSPSVAEHAMICVLNFARVRDGLKPLPVSPLLQRSSRLKALAIVRCQQFSHGPCGTDPHAVADKVGYPQVDWGENIFAGSGPFVPARLAGDGWLNSPHHRENIFAPRWTEQGIALVVARDFKGRKNVAIWVSEFGAR